MAQSSLPRSILLALAMCYGICAQYALVDNYTPDVFFSKFDFFTGGDPTNGNVQYVDQSTAQSSGLIQTFTDSVYVGVDNTTVLDPSSPNRASVRLQSTATYTKGLFILSLGHMPFGCGTWPAWWTLGVGAEWPSLGEIDIIEGVNTNTLDQSTLHTGPDCTIAGTGETGTLLTNNCTSSPADNSGCGVQSSDTASYGDGFNQNGGGTYAMEWTDNYIQTWFFPPSSVPSSIASGQPDTSTFGTPLAYFAGDCNIDEKFSNHQIIFDITFCGDYAGNTYSTTSCPNASGGLTACVDYVAQNPSAFSDTYWSINSLQVYQLPASSTEHKHFDPPKHSKKPAAATRPALSSSLRYAGMGGSAPATKTQAPSAKHT